MFTGVSLILYTCAVLFVAYVVRGIAGFGSGLIAIPLLTLAHPLSLVVPLVIALDYIGSAAQGINNRQSIKWSEIVPLLPTTLIGCVVALYLFKSIEINNLTKAMAVFIIVFAVYQLLPLPQLRGSRIWAAPAGFFGGLIGTVFGTGGPFYMMYLSIRELSKTETRASFASYFFIDGSIRIIGFIVIGMLGLVELKVLLTWLPAAALGLWIGGKVHTDISAKTFKYFISLLLVVSGYRLLTR